MKLLLFHIFMKITVLLVNGFFWDFDLGADFWGWIILSWNFGSESRSWGNLKFAVFLLFSNCSWKPLRPVPWWKFMQLKRFLFPWTGEFQTGGSPCKEKHVVLLSPVGKIEISGCETGLHEIKLPKMSRLPSGWVHVLLILWLCSCWRKEIAQRI